ncbi:E22 family MetX-like putative esterase [Chelatococcus reniformis]|uniref:Probable acyltransferase n=1 Tax=Chelatococcus reniformis TaxID=1494448 RepID=A0A916X9W5_9HYPH|nr:homoserine O-acetyltransferase [Chelatococcus reniformis]GGC55823.1 homoserine O-acetyltransferase [Chelatococcus reniformis]
MAGLLDGVRKQLFELPRYETLGGRVLSGVRVGWESYGELNAERSNAILICHYFSGTSHAAGRYAPGDPLPGYWDAIIGPGKPIDTDRFFVLSSDTLINLNVHDPKVATTGPASIDPASGKPYGLDFPIVEIGDFVRVQRELVRSLGIEKLHAVAGPSMGGLQAFDWAVRFPEMVGRILPVICAGAADPWLVAWLDAWAAPIALDAQWNGGDYYGKAAPTAGLLQALKMVALHANDRPWALATFGTSPAAGGNPRAGLAQPFAIVDGLAQLAALRVALCDANHLLYLARANQLYVAGGADDLGAAMARVRAPVLYITTPTDHVFPPAATGATAAALRDSGARVRHLEIGGSFGHLNGLLTIGEAAEAIAAFMNDQPVAS